MQRDFVHVQCSPVAGDTVEIFEPTTGCDGDVFDCEIMLRVMAVQEGYVWFKQYGKGGRHTCTLKGWQERLKNAISGKVVVYGGDPSHPF
jgi:hypothetical protein